MDKEQFKKHEGSQPMAEAPSQPYRHGWLTDQECFNRAKARGQETFTLVEQDRSAPRVIIEWIKENIETCPAPKLYEALARAIAMRGAPYRKDAD